MAAKKATRKRSPRKRTARTTASRAAATERILDCVPSRERERDWTARNVADAAPASRREARPDELDLRADWWRIGNQESTGACVGWALADSVLRWHFVDAGKLAPDALLSPRFLWMAAKETDEFVSRPTSFLEAAGTSLKAALDIARKFGCIPNDMLPFDSNNLYRGNPESFYARAATLRIGMYAALDDQREWKPWIHDRGPILVRIEVDRKWYSASKATPVLDHYDPLPPGDARIGGHAVAIVGYTDDGNFIVRNSWGMEWGEDGYAYATPLYLDKAISEAYGVYV